MKIILLVAVWFWSALAWAYPPLDGEVKAAFDALPKITEAQGQAVLDEIAKLIRGLEEGLGIGGTGFSYKLEKVASLPEGRLSSIVPEVSRSSVGVVLKITPEGMKSPAVILDSLIELNQIYGALEFALPAGLASSNGFSSPLHWVETLWNAQAGSRAAQAKLVALDSGRVRKGLKYATQDVSLVKAFPWFMEAVKDQGLWEGYLGLRENQLNQLAENARKEAVTELKARQAKWAEQRKSLDAVEKGPKLNELVLKNDRKGVRQLLQSYLPWPLMEPSEKAFWTQWLEALEKPDPKRARVCFRGLDDVSPLKGPKGVEAELSTVLMRNQGNYNRRLRSLATLREKIGTVQHVSSTGMARALEGSSVATMMYNHAIEPLGSPFISVSTLDISQRFGAARLGSYLIDERRVLPNVMTYQAEAERLVPLIIFPEEIVAIRQLDAATAVAIDGDYNSEASQKLRTDLIADTEAKLGRKLNHNEMLRIPQGMDHAAAAKAFSGEAVIRFHDDLQRGFTTLGCPNVLKQLLK